MKLADWMKMTKMNQEGLAERLNTSRASVSRWLRGVTRPSLEKILEISTCRRDIDLLYRDRHPHFTRFRIVIGEGECFGC